MPFPLQPFSDKFVYYLHHFSEAEDGFVWLSDDHPQFLQTLGEESAFERQRSRLN